jgi:ABC-type molybdate transport system permease subunit
VLAKSIKGPTREALFLLVILPFWSNSLVRIFSWAIVLRGNGVLERSLERHPALRHQLNLMFTGRRHRARPFSYLPYVILTCYLTLQAIDDDLIDAARSLGASRSPSCGASSCCRCRDAGADAGAVLIFVPVVGSFMEPRILGGRMGTYFGTVIEDQFVAVFNWPLGAALSFILLAVVLLILASPCAVLRGRGCMTRWRMLGRVYAGADPVLSLRADPRHGGDVFNASPFYQLPFEFSTEVVPDLAGNGRSSATCEPLRPSRVVTVLATVVGRPPRSRCSATSSVASGCCRCCSFRPSRSRGSSPARRC